MHIPLILLAAGDSSHELPNLGYFFAFGLVYYNNIQLPSLLAMGPSTQATPSQ
jgi:hypothetical protein